MDRLTPMRRLLLGEVGSGKTVVALHAAARAAGAGFEAAILAPTTILADQHHRTLRRRFAAFPVTIDLLSRFRTGDEQKEVVRERVAMTGKQLAAIAAPRVDASTGTLTD